MFTGIVKAQGVVRSIQQRPGGARLSLNAPDLPRPIADGASICVNGACLTVTHSDKTVVEFDVVTETLSRTTLGSLAGGQKVNLEPALRLGDAMDGHTVQGHVDGTARVDRIETAGGHVATFRIDKALMDFVIPKGSIAIDGVSLTIANVGDDTFSVAVIPTTLTQTTLGSLRVGDSVNIETDILARTIITTLERRQKASKGPPLTVDMLRENGW